VKAVPFKDLSCSRKSGYALSKNISKKGPRNCRSLGFPGFPVELGVISELLRLSSMKAAHVAISGAA
jgi:hypothetical protein